MKFRAMTAVSVLALMIALPGYAADASASSFSGPRFVPRADIPVGQYTASDESDDRSDRREYNKYEHREQCQHYRRVPRNSVELSDCSVVKAEPAPVVVTEQRTSTATQSQLLPIIHTETVYFDFDRSGIRANQNATLDKVAGEIDTYKPADVTVTGYADRSGPASYNEKLSERRARSVSSALKNRGIVNEQIDQKARGETDNAVPTADGVKMAQNRRVVIDFRR
jgi:outer membrane protein OmpA-like peptidoglycan-associated protein